MKITFSTAKVLTALIKELEGYFPNQIPIHKPTTIEELRLLQGNQEVIQYIRNLVDHKDDQTEIDEFKE